MKITINGQLKEIDSANMAQLVGQFCANSKNIITEINGTIVHSDQWSCTPIKDGDTVELVAFVGGG